MSYKKRAIQYTRREGKARLEYWVVSDDGTIRSCAPQPWHALKLEDQTTSTTMEAAARLRYLAANRQVRDLVDDNAWLRAASVPEGTRYQSLCAHVGIRY